MITTFKLFEDIKTNFSLGRIRGMHRDRILDIINDKDNEKLWDLTTFVDWPKFIKDRDEKINFDELRGKVEEKFGDLTDFSRIYHLIYDKLKEYFEVVWLEDDSKLHVSDDSYTDLISSIVGNGKDFIKRTLNDDDVVLNMVKNNEYRENFGYIFND